MKISVIGCGYLGAVHAVCMAELGHEVIGVDVDEAKIAMLSSGRTPFFEPGLPELLTKNLASGRLSFTTDMSAVKGAAVHFVGVGTPQQKGSNAADLRFVDAAIETLIPHLGAGELVAGKSTVPVGTAARLAALVSEGAPGALLAWNPEFLREGFAIKDTLTPDRFVYGVPAEAADHSTALLDEVYATALASGTPRLVTDYATAELVKISANAFLATKISFINAMAEIAEASGADVTMLADAIGHDARIGRRFLNSGLGFGGGCLPKDIRAFQARAEEIGAGDSLKFLHEIDEINLRRRQRMVSLAVEALGGDVSGKKIAALGLAFKPDSDDVRDSPSLDVAASLHALGAHVAAFDPEANATAARQHPELGYADSAEAALSGADLVLVLTEWREFRELDPALVATSVASPIVIDGRNCLDREAWRAAGWDYSALGRP